ncbi:microprocessor complex subunit DGCR8 [Achroia grisella]|uniref:microprocessor complex subunit DGCR8 n=1 Tax=Achroia grisella TaxID=688607 RepID=UPI0027D318B9|nr:microprocessor complex subunit DGCR8 [Achroia grisella]
MSEEIDVKLPPLKKQKLETDADGMDFSNDVAGGDDFSAGNDKYSNYVDPEELEKLKEFTVLDEVKSNDEDSNDEESGSSDGKSEGLPEEEIEKMLEEDLPENFRGTPKPKEKPYITRQKIVLEDKGVNHFEVLPLDWMMVRHYSGMPVYMHRTTRVCTLSKPYCLGKGNTRRHDIPISAIPCLAYRRALQEEDKHKEIDRRIAEQIKNGTWINNQRNDKSKDDVNVSLRENVTPIKCPYQKYNELDQTDQTKCPFNKGNKSEQTVDINVNNKGLIETKDVIKTNKQTNEQDVENKPEKERMETEMNELNEVTKVEQDVSETVDEESNEQKVSEADDVKNFGGIPLNRQPVVLPGGIVMAPPRVETVNSSWKTQHLSHEQVNDYCKKLFKFKTVNIMHFKSWADRRKYTKARKTLQYPTLPEGTKVITIPAPITNGQENRGKPTRDWVMNMNGRSYLSEFHEYVWRALQKQPVYEFKQLENAMQPYQATVYIGGMQYGVGRGSSKRQAKSAAARASIHILIPEMRDDGHHTDTPATHHAPAAPATHAAPAPDTDLFFDEVEIEDPRITEICVATCEPSPHDILRTCLLRNFGAGERHIHTEMKKLEFQKIELTMKVGKHTATVVCKNKKTAKQRASQSILQLLHPHVRTWGSLLRLYGSRSVKSCKEKKLEEQEITLLQDKARHNEPNYAVIEKLRHEMRKLRERDEAVVPIGTLLLKDELPTHSGANLDNVDL